MPRFAQARAVLGQAVDPTAPIERLVLGVALAQPPCDLRLHQLGAEIEGVRRILSNTELGKERESILRDVVAVSIIDVNSILGRLDAKVGVLDLGRQISAISCGVLGNGDRSCSCTNAPP